ncbi:MAG: hypothetical protein R3C11_13700 [Planctomycetaceae bacterium]
MNNLRYLSHLAPITDFTSYNLQALQHQASIAKDLMLSLQLQTTSTTGKFALRIHDGNVNYEVQFNLPRNQVELYVADSQSPVLTRPLPDIAFESGKRIEFSTFDRHLQLAIDGQIIIEPWALPFTMKDQSYARIPVEIGAQGSDFQISNLQLFRDIYYRSDFPAQVRHATTKPYQTGPDEFFVLGDNSMRSWDSRCWTNPVFLAITCWDVP